MFSQLSEVKEACEFEESSGTALSQVKGSLRRNVEFWRNIGFPRYIYCQLYARVTVCLFYEFHLGLPPEIIDQLKIIQSLLMKPFWSFYIQPGLWN